MDGEQSKYRFTLNYKILVLGEEGIGKTSLIRQYIEKKFTHDYKTTLGADLKTKVLILDDHPATGERSKCVLQIWDIAGKTRISSLKQHYYKGGHGVFLVFDATSKDSLTNLQRWANDVDKYCPDAVKYLIGNKIDLIDDVVIAENEIDQMKEILGVKYCTKTSAKTGENVDKAFETIPRLIFEKVAKKLVFERSSS